MAIYERLLTTKFSSSQGRTEGLGSSFSFLGSRTYLPDPYTTRENLIFFVLEGKLEHMKLLLNLEQVSKIIAFKNYLLAEQFPRACYLA